MAAPKKSKQTDITISDHWQMVFIFVVLLSWLIPFVLMLTWNLGNYVNLGSWLFQISMNVLPISFWIVAAIYAWRRYSTVLHKMFATTLLAFVGFSAYSSVASVESIVHYRFFPPVLTDMNDSSLITAFGHEWLSMAIGIIVFASVLVWQKRRQKG